MIGTVAITAEKAGLSSIPVALQEREERIDVVVSRLCLALAI